MPQREEKQGDVAERKAKDFLRKLGTRYKYEIMASAFEE